MFYVTDCYVLRFSVLWGDLAYCSFSCPLLLALCI